MAALMERIRATAFHEHAADNLRFIRDTMARAGRFGAVPGWGAAAMGVTALVTALVAGPPRAGTTWLAWWLGDAALAVAIGVVAMARKARRIDSSLAGAPARQFALAFVPAVLAGAVLTAVFVENGLTLHLPGVWLVTYGAAVSSAGALSERPVRITGIAIFAIGVLAFLCPVSWGTAFMALGFGVTQIAGGIAIGRAHHG